jgi:hypothetical protein
MPGIHGRASADLSMTGGPFTPNDENGVGSGVCGGAGLQPAHRFEPAPFGAGLNACPITPRLVSAFRSIF